MRKSTLPLLSLYTYVLLTALIWIYHVSIHIEKISLIRFQKNVYMASKHDSSIELVNSSFFARAYLFIYLYKKGRNRKNTYCVWPSKIREGVVIDVWLLFFVPNFRFCYFCKTRKFWYAWNNMLGCRLYITITTAIIVVLHNEVHKVSHLSIFNVWMHRINICLCCCCILLLQELSYWFRERIRKCSTSFVDQNDVA